MMRASARCPISGLSIPFDVTAFCRGVLHIDIDSPLICVYPAGEQISLFIVAGARVSKIRAASRVRIRNTCVSLLRVAPARERFIITQNRKKRNRTNALYIVSFLRPNSLPPLPRSSVQVISVGARESKSPFRSSLGKSCTKANDAYPRRD